MIEAAVIQYYARELGDFVPAPAKVLQISAEITQQVYFEVATTADIQ